MSTWYAQGTVTLTAGSKSVTGVGTQWVSNVLPGGIFFTPAGPYEVDTIASDTSMQLVKAYAGSTASGLTYEIAPTQGYVVALTKYVAALTADYGALRSAWQDGNFVEVNNLLQPEAASTINFLPAGTGAVPTNTQQKLRETPSIFDLLTPAERTDVATGAKTIDLTAKLNQAFIQYRDLRINRGLYRINPDIGLSVQSNTTLYMEPGAEFHSSASSDAVYELLKFYGCTNVTVFGDGARVVGDRAAHVGTTGEFGYGVSFRGCKGVTIYGLRADECWGDGFFFGNLAAANSCSDGVLLFNVSGDYNRRQGCSITSGKNVTLYRPRFTRTQGTPPAAGIDIEPNYPYDALQNIVIVEPYTENSQGAGIVVNLDKLDATSPEVSIKIKDPISQGDDYGFVANAKAMGGLKGLVEVHQPRAMDSFNNGILATYWDVNGPRLEIHQPKVYRPNNRGLSTVLYGAGIQLGRTAGETGAPGQINGGILITRPTTVDNRPVPKMTRSIVARDSVANFVDTRIVDPMEASGYTAANPMRVSDGAYMLDTLGVLKRSVAITSNQFLNADDVQATVYDNAGQAVAGVLEYTLPSAAKWKGPRTFNVLAPQTLRVIRLASEQLLDASGQDVGSIQSNVVGSQLVIEAFNATQWRIVSRAGVWTQSIPTPGYVLTVAVAYDPPSIAPGATVTVPVALAAAAVGDFASVSFSASLGGLRITAHINAAGSVSVDLWNPTAAAIDPGAGTLRVRVVKA